MVLPHFLTMVIMTAVIFVKRDFKEPLARHLGAG